MSLTSEIQIAPLDFDSIRASIKRFLKNQSTLTDYNFEGSTLSLLIDVLAYDAYYHGWYTNFAVNETFLHTAQIRNSVVAAARQIGYVPRSTASALVVADVTVGNVNTSEGSITLPKYTPVTSSLSGNTYTFYTTADYSEFVNGASNVVFTEVELYEGTKLVETFDITTVSNTGTSITLLNQNVDSRTISVIVKPSSGSSTTYNYDRATTAVTVNASSNVYFLFETNNGTYDLQFGDGKLGRNLSVGQQVIVTYLDSRGIEGNGANTFSYGGNALGTLSQTSNVSVVLSNINIPAYGGASRETIDAIKKNAPAIYQTQGRIVTTADARAVILAEVNGIDSVSVWGGEDHDPPTYGKVYISMKPVNAEKFGPTQKDYIKSKILQPKSLPIVSYELLDPDYIYVIVSTQARYNPGSTSLTEEVIRQQVSTAISSYALQYLGQFGSYFRYSQLSSVIDKSDNSIQSNLTTVELEKRVTVNSAVTSYSVEFSNPIYQPESSANVVSLTTKVGNQTFSHRDIVGITRRGCYLMNSNTTINVYRDELGARLLVKSGVGTIDFDSGLVSLTNFSPSAITTNLLNELRIRVIPRDSDLVPTRTQIILIPDDGITVAVVEDLLNRTRTTFGRVTAGGRLGAGSFS